MKRISMSLPTFLIEGLKRGIGNGVRRSSERGSDKNISEF